MEWNEPIEKTTALNPLKVTQVPANFHFFSVSFHKTFGNIERKLTPVIAKLISRFNEEEKKNYGKTILKFHPKPLQLGSLFLFFQFF